MSRSLTITARTLFPRSVRQVCADVDAEIRHHVDSRRGALIDSGMHPQQADIAASEAFGDIPQVRAEMISIGLAPWKRLAFATLLALLILILALGLYAWTLHTHAGVLKGRNLDLESRVSGQIGAIEALRSSETLRPAQTLRTVRVQGAVRDPRAWSFTRETEVTLSELVQKSGGLLDNATGRVILLDMRPQGPSEPRIFMLSDVLSGMVPDPLLSKSCTVVLEVSED